MAHNDLVFDAGRNVYYAAVPSSVVGNGNTIASIDPSTGAVTYSQPVGANPNVLSLSPDGQYLYVGLDGAGEVVKLALPALTEVTRISLGTEPTYGTLYANSIAVSPVDSNVFAVSLKAKTVTPSHRGVALFNGTVMAPNKTQAHTGSNEITFGADGTVLFGYNDESTESGLRKINVDSNGLTEVQVVPVEGTVARNLQYRNDKLYLSSRVYWPDTLSLLGQFRNGDEVCNPFQSGGKVACAPMISATQGPDITVHDTSTFVTLSTKPSPETSTAVRKFVPGPAGTVAVSYANYFEPAPKLYLLSSTDF